MERRILSYKLFEEKETPELTQEQIRWLNTCTSCRWEINPDTGLVDVLGSFDCFQQGLTDFKGIRFGTVSSYFYCDSNQLTSLTGAPEKVGGSFYCNNNRLTNLVGSPKEVGGNFHCERNQLTSLEGAPEIVYKNFYCQDNNLTNLIGSPKEVSGFHCDNNQLTSLEGAPERIKIYLNYDGNPVSSVTLVSIQNLMNKGNSYQEALSQYWDQMPEEDKILMHADNPDLSADDRKGYDLRAKVSKRTY
jgi:hypothetical protein